MKTVTIITLASLKCAELHRSHGGQDKPSDEQRWWTGTADGSEDKPKGKTKP